MSIQIKHVYGFGPVRLDSEKHVLIRDGKPVSLAPKAAELQLVLVEKAGYLVDKDHLIKRVGPDAIVEEGNQNKNISLLRKALGDWDGAREYIETVSQARLPICGACKRGHSRRSWLSCFLNECSGISRGKGPFRCRGCEQVAVAI